jgi:DNA-binding MarR family transcriptional regulator
MTLEEIVRLLIFVGHWARVDFERFCEPEEYVAHEVLFLRALARFGDGTTCTELARVLGWTKGRVSEVGSELVEKGQITRGRRLAVTQQGLYESANAAFVFAAVAERILDGVDERTREELFRALHAMKSNVVSLSRDREDPSRL